MRFARVATLTALAALTVPATASAHGGPIQRTALPIPEWLFGWGAAAVLVVSFAALAVLWPRPKLEQTPWRPLPWNIGRLLGSRVVDIVCGAIGVALLVVVIVAGYIGPAAPLNNFAATFIMITFWVGLVFLSLLFGDVFRAFNPWRAIGRATGAVLGRRAPVPRPYPERLGRWPAAVGLVGFAWIELAGGWANTPPTLVTAVIGYTVVTLAAQSVWGTETWQRRGEAFSVYFNLFARISPFETRDRVVGVRPPLAGLPKLDPAPGTVAFVTAMIGTVTFDGLSQGRVWKDVLPDIVDVFTSLGASVTTAPKLAATVGLLLGWALVSGFYWLGMEGARGVGGGIPGPRLRMTFIHALVPIAAVYVAAHYFGYLLGEGQAIKYLVSDPFGQGWDLFGTASSAINFSLIGQNTTWYIQVAFVVVGHVCALVLAHDRALSTYGQASLAVRSQYWMLAIMLGFTMLALWLLWQTGA
jgi:hypothetical protein